MDQILPKLYKEYGTYSNWRQLPSIRDGLKPVERRILYAAYEIARQKMVKSARVDGHVTGNYHPHGSVYGSIVQLVRQGFLDGQGNFGCNIGVEPVGAAASRYTEIRMPKETSDLAFQHLKHVEWEENELGQNEPTFLPVKFPMCLLGTEYTQGIGFGYKTLIPCYTIGNLYSRLKWLLGQIKTKPTIPPITDCIITSQPKVLEDLLTTGEAKIDVKGIIEVDKKSNVVILKAWPPGKRFEAIIKKFVSHLNSGEVGFSDLSTTETNIVFKVLRERNRDKIFTQFLKKLQDAITGTISFNMSVVEDNKVITKSIDDLLLQTFNQFKEVNYHMLGASIEELKDVITEYKILKVIRPHLSSCINRKISISASIDLINKQTKVPKVTIKSLLQKYRIIKLLSLDLDTKQLENQKKDLEKNIKNIETFTLEQYGG